MRKALEALNPDGGKPFKPFASKAIKNAILDAVRDENNTTEARLAEKGYSIFLRVYQLFPGCRNEPLHTRIITAF